MSELGGHGETGNDPERPKSLEEQIEEGKTDRAKWRAEHWDEQNAAWTAMYEKYRPEPEPWTDEELASTEAASRHGAGRPESQTTDEVAGTPPEARVTIVFGEPADELAGPPHQRTADAEPPSSHGTERERASQSEAQSDAGPGATERSESPRASGNDEATGAGVEEQPSQGGPGERPDEPDTGWLTETQEQRAGEYLAGFESPYDRPKKGLPTRGYSFDDQGGETPVVSGGRDTDGGRDGLVDLAADLLATHGLDRRNDLKKHVEIKEVSRMVRDNVQHMTTVINHKVCKQCDQMLPRLVPEGRTYTVVDPEGTRVYRRRER